jgi:hypothetical protein
MPNCVRVICPDCGGTSTDSHFPTCGWCMDGGFIDIDRNLDGTVPLMHPDGRTVHLMPPPAFPLYAFASRP